MRKLLFFHAPWCSPCRFYTGQFIEPLEQLAGTEQVIRINAQNEPFMAKKYRVDKLPTMILLDGDTVHMECTGAIDIGKVAKWLKGGDPTSPSGGE